MPQEVDLTRHGGSWLARAPALTLVFLFFVGCGDSTGPAPNVDPAATQAALEQVIDQYLNDNPGLNTLEIFGADIGDALPSIAPVNFALHPEPPSLFGLAGRLGRTVRAAHVRGTTLPPLITTVPPELHGTTFIFHPDSSPNYFPSNPPREGAPENGVRFILYEDKTAANEVGYLDLIDESNTTIDPLTIDVTLMVFITEASPTLPVLNYHVTGTASDIGGTLFVTGSLSDGSSQLDFDFDVTGSDATGYSAAFALSAGELSVTFDIIETTTGSQTLEASIGAGSADIRFLIEIDANGDIRDSSGVFFDDGSGEVLVATFTGNIEQKIHLTNAQGDALMQQELLALANMFSAMEYAVVTMEELFAFGLALVGVAFFF